MTETKRSETNEEDIKDLLSKAAGAGILAATGHPVAVVLGVIETGVIIKERVARLRKNKSSETSVIQNPDTIFEK